MLRFLEEREGAKREQLSFPDTEGHPHPVELSCMLAGQLLAIEHTGIEPFEGQLRSDRHASAFFDPIVERLSGVLSHDDLYGLYVPIDATHGLKPRDVPRIQERIVAWILSVAPTLPVARTGRLKGPQENVAVPGVPFPLSLYRQEGFPGVRTPLIVKHVLDGTRMEQARRERIATGYNKKMGKLSAWKREAGARTILIFESIDIQLTNAFNVAEAVIDIVGHSAERPDEILLVTSCADPWWVSPILVNDESLVDLADFEWRWIVDPQSLQSLTGR